VAVDKPELRASDVELRVSDSDRQRAVMRLREAHAEGRLTLEELSQRADLAYAARTQADLARTTGDLPPPAPVSRKRRRRFALGLLGGRTLRGRWRAGPRLVAVALFGGADIDLREAQLDAGRLTIVSLALFGGSDVYVPQGIEVDVAGFALFGGHDEHGSEGEIHPASPLVRIVGLSLFGGMDVHHVRASSAPARRS
jgi:hypothetical protein